ncbi:hypothetical protein MCAP1_000387 [Malassezia caprae]|uniref:ER membrane protein complex subunit 1 n=1 Tax=Malassezia caprae TaxID=1381934 RepID=A0AAF0IV53_9BASI|nr:hypothetical protein MCAP1_000387 [Malassezia caprae]
MLARLLPWLVCLAVLASLVPQDTSANAFLHLLQPKKPAPEVITHLSTYLGAPTTQPHETVRLKHPRFQRFIRDLEDVNTKTSTAFITGTEAHSIGALNPRDGGMVWRRLLNEDENVLGMFSYEDMLLLGTDKNGVTVRMMTAKHGIMEWEQNFPVTVLDDQLPFHATFLASGGSDVVLVVGNAVHRINHANLIWTWEPTEPQRVLYVVDYEHFLYVVGAKRVGDRWQPRITVLSQKGEHLATYDVRDDVLDLKAIVLLPYKPRAHIPEIFHALPGGGPHIAYLARDGSVHAIRLNQPTPGIKLLKARSGRFIKLQDVGVSDRGLFVAWRADASAEVLHIEPDGSLRSAWEMDEKAPDSVFEGTYDRRGHAYIMRVYFTRAQRLLNQHIFWADAQSHGGRGQVTGVSFQFDHDRHGNAKAASFEVAVTGPQQLSARVALVTSSGSVQLIKDTEHQWILEEGLAQPVKTLLVPLPDASLGRGAVSLNAPAQQPTPFAVLERESLIARVTRHSLALLRIPQVCAQFLHTRGFYDLASLIRAFEHLLGHKITHSKRGPTAGGPRDASQALLPWEPPREASDVALYHDRFGFEQLVLAASKQGKVYGINQTLGGSHIVWERSLVGFGIGEGETEPVVRITHLVQTRATGAMVNGSIVPPLVAIVAEVAEPDRSLETRMFELNPLTGEYASDAAEWVLCPGTAREVFQYEGGLGVVCSDGRILHRTGAAPQYIATATEHALQGYQIHKPFDSGWAPALGKAKSSLVWRMELAPNETIVAMRDLSRDHVASAGKVRGDRTVLYKYLHPQARLVVTFDRVAKEGRLYLVDIVTGQLLYHALVPDMTHPRASVTYAENWITLQYTSDESGPERLLSMEMYESEAPAGAQWSKWWGGHADDESTTALTTPLVFMQTFVLPYSVRAMGVTRTTLGVASRSLVVATNRSEVVLLPRRMLDPRRPLGKPSKADTEERLVPYQVRLPDEALWKLTKPEHLGARLDALTISPALLESSSMVLATGLDWVYTVASPSGPFDRLHASFNKTQLVLTILGLFLGIAITQPVVRMRALNARWH